MDHVFIINMYIQYKMVLLCCHYYIQLIFFLHTVQILDLVEKGFDLSFRALDLSNDRLLWGFEAL
jgi:hypothetical protein